MALAASVVAYDAALAESAAASISGWVVTNNMDFPFSQPGPTDNIGHVSWWPKHRVRVRQNQQIDCGSGVLENAYDAAQCAVTNFPS